jgi:F-type H+-transporting ATPase subunit a
MKYIKHLLLIFLMILTVVPVSAADGEKKGIDVGSIVFGHIKDSYEWHVTDIGQTKLIIPLPVIVRTHDGTWHFFNGCRVYEEANIEGLYLAKDGTHEGKLVENVNGVEVRPLDLSITKQVCVLFIDCIIVLLCVLFPARWYKRRKVSDDAPKGFTGFMEMFIMYVVDDMIKPSIGKGYEKYVPYLLTVFFFIFTCNIMGVVPFPPGGGNVTGNIAITFFLAVMTFIITQFSGTKHYWKEIFWPDVPMWLKPIMAFIEFFGIFTKPFALMVRLFANMLAGHAIILSLMSIIFIMAPLGALLCGTMTVLSVAFGIFMDTLEILICFIQAMVFTMLSATFIGLARVKPAEA